MVPTPPMSAFFFATCYRGATPQKRTRIRHSSYGMIQRANTKIPSSGTYSLIYLLHVGFILQGRSQGQLINTPNKSTSRQSTRFLFFWIQIRVKVISRSQLWSLDLEKPYERTQRVKRGEVQGKHGNLANIRIQSITKFAASDADLPTPQSNICPF